MFGFGSTGWSAGLRNADALGGSNSNSSYYSNYGGDDATDHQDFMEIWVTQDTTVNYGPVKENCEYGNCDQKVGDPRCKRACPAARARAQEGTGYNDLAVAGPSPCPDYIHHRQHWVPCTQIDPKVCQGKLGMSLGSGKPLGFPDTEKRDVACEYDLGTRLAKGMTIDDPNDLKLFVQYKLAGRIKKLRVGGKMVTDVSEIALFTAEILWRSLGKHMDDGRFIPIMDMLWKSKEPELAKGFVDWYCKNQDPKHEGDLCKCAHRQDSARFKELASRPWAKEKHVDDDCWYKPCVDANSRAWLWSNRDRGTWTCGKLDCDDIDVADLEDGLVKCHESDAPVDPVPVVPVIPHHKRPDPPKDDELVVLEPQRKRVKFGAQGCDGGEEKVDLRHFRDRDAKQWNTSCDTRACLFAPYQAAVGYDTMATWEKATGNPKYTSDDSKPIYGAMDTCTGIALDACLDNAEYGLKNGTPLGFVAEKSEPGAPMLACKYSLKSIPTDNDFVDKLIDKFPDNKDRILTEVCGRADGYKVQRCADAGLLPKGSGDYIDIEVEQRTSIKGDVPCLNQGKSTLGLAGDCEDLPDLHVGMDCRKMDNLCKEESDTKPDDPGKKRDGFFRVGTYDAKYHTRFSKSCYDGDRRLKLDMPECTYGDPVRCDSVFGGATADKVHGNYMGFRDPDATPPMMTCRFSRGVVTDEDRLRRLLDLQSKGQVALGTVDDQQRFHDAVADYCMPDHLGKVDKTEQCQRWQKAFPREVRERMEAHCKQHTDAPECRCINRGKTGDEARDAAYNQLVNTMDLQLPVPQCFWADCNDTMNKKTLLPTCDDGKQDSSGCMDLQADCPSGKHQTFCAAVIENIGHNTWENYQIGNYVTCDGSPRPKPPKPDGPVDPIPFGPLDPLVPIPGSRVDPIPVVPTPSGPLDPDSKPVVPVVPIPDGPLDPGTGGDDDDDNASGMLVGGAVVAALVLFGGAFAYSQTKK